MQGGSCCASKEPTTCDKPNTTHAPLRWMFPRTAKLVDTHHKAKGLVGNQKPKRSPKHTGRCEKGEAGQHFFSINKHQLVEAFGIEHQLVFASFRLRGKPSKSLLLPEMADQDNAGGHTAWSARIWHLNSLYPPIYTFCTKSKVTGTDIKFLRNHNF